MIKYKLLAVDLDGTLLSRSKRISKSNFESLKAYTNQGGIPVITTGRSIVSAEKYAIAVARYTNTKSEYVIAFNGAYIKNIKTGQVNDAKIPHKIALELKEFALKNKLVL
jgi:hydroxymethylpyrimidine pyrophosphatase-like HAD family hydrolase